MKITTVVVFFLALACGGNKSAAPGSEGTPDVSAEPGRDTAGSAGLCIDPKNIQIEPLDLEALDDELPPVSPGSPLADLLDGFAEHGSALPLDGGARVVPFVRCSDAGCEAGIMTVDAGGKQRSVVPLPGLDASLPAGTRLELVTARADVNSDGTPELWVGYRKGDPESSPSTQNMAAFTLPAVELQWHGVISQSSPAAEDEGCDGVLYPVDADCDGDGDLVLAQRCGPMRCLSDDSEGCAGVTIDDRMATYLWDSRAGKYSPRK